MSDFVHLHVHSDYSMLDGGITIDNLVKTAKEMGMPALALTDHGNMFGAIEFYLKCQKAGIKPILGYEAYVAPGARSDRTPSRISDASYHLTLLVKDETGYRNLMKLATAAYREGYYYRPRIDREILAERSKGIIGLSGCLKSEVAELLQDERVDEARAVIDQYRDIFEPGHFFLELQENGIPEQNTVNGHLVKIAGETGLPLVGTNDIHYLGKDDYEAHDVLLCIGTGKLKKDTNRMSFERNEFYFKSAEEMKKAFHHAPEAIANTLRIAEMAALKLDFDAYHHPVFRCPEGKTPAQYLREIAERGFKRRYKEVTPQIRERFEYELEVIEKMGFCSYLLIVWDIVRYAREQGIPVGPGRGSAVGSLVCYLLGITDLDPFRYDLIFERFINPGRNELPDIDLDFCQERRGEMLKYVTERYGRECVSQIITFSTMLAKGSLRDVGRALDVPLADVDRLAKKVPDKLGVTLENALQDPDFVQLMQSNPVYGEMVDTARRLEGLARNPGIHAAGVVIADRDISDYCPLYQPPGTEDITTQYDMKMCEQIGLLKIDFLGLATLTLIELAVKTIQERHGVNLDMDALPLDDAKTYELLGRGEAKGVFQFESDGMRQLLVSAKPSCLEDLIALNAMYRPGPMDFIPTFTNRKHGREPIQYLHPKLEPILHNTYGVIVYQEQVIRIANQIAGLSLSEADSLRKAMGKKIQALMDSYRKPFIEGATKNEFTQEQATALWEQLVEFAKYGFNKSHAAAYAFLAFQTAYLKAHYPAEFMAALLTIEIGKQDKVSDYIQECRRMGIAVLPPDINVSRSPFTPLDEGIRFGLGAVKNVGAKAVERIVETREQQGPFKSLYDFCERVDSRAVNRQTIEALIKCGAFDGTGAKRSQLLLAVDDAMQMGSAAQADRAAGQLSLFGGGPSATTPSAEPSLPQVDELPKPELLALERDMLGFYVTGHPLEQHLQVARLFSNATTRNLKELPDGKEVQMIGIITRMRSTMGRKGKIVRIGFEDMEGAREVSIFSDQATAAGDALNEGRIIILRGRVQTFRDEPDIRVLEIIPVEQAYQRLTRRLILKLETNGKGDREGPGTIEQQVTRLRRIMKGHRGGCPVLIDIPVENETRALLAVGEQFGVTPDDEFRKEVEELLGKDAVTYAV
jgi:DNA polymerase-3 subunit alpha